MGQTRPFYHFRPFHISQFKYKLIKAFMGCWGVKPGAAGWQAQSDPLTYGGRPRVVFIFCHCNFRPGLVVMRGNTCSKGLEFKSRHRVLDGHFFTLL